MLVRQCFRTLRPVRSYMCALCSVWQPPRACLVASPLSLLAVNHACCQNWVSMSPCTLCTCSHTVAVGPNAVWTVSHCSVLAGSAADALNPACCWPSINFYRFAPVLHIRCPILFPPGSVPVPRLLPCPRSVACSDRCTQSHDPHMVHSVLIRSCVDCCTACCSCVEGGCPRTEIDAPVRL